MNSLYYFLKAKEDIDDLYNVKMIDWLFEDGEEVTNTLKANETKGTGIVASIKKGIQALINLLKKMISSFTSFISTLGMSREQREKYNMFRNYVKSNPELAHKTVTVKDWKVFEKMYGDIEKFIDAEAQKENPNMGVIDDMMKKVEQMLKDTGVDVTAKNARKLVTKISLDTLLSVADSNVMAAKGLKASMERELSALESLEKEVGAKEVARFKKKLTAYANNGFAHRARVKLFHLKEKTLQEIISEHIRLALDFTNIEDPSKPFVNNRSIIKGFGKHKGKAIKAAVRYGKDGIAVAKDINNYQDTVKQGTKSIKQFGSDVTATAKNAAKTGKKYAKQAKQGVKDTGRFFGIR